MENKDLLSIETLLVGAHSREIANERNSMLSAHNEVLGIINEMSEAWKGKSGIQFNENMNKYIVTLKSSIDYLENYSKYLIDAIELYAEKDEYFKRKVEEASTNLPDNSDVVPQGTTGDVQPNSDVNTGQSTTSGSAAPTQDIGADGKPSGSTEPAQDTGAAGKPDGSAEPTQDMNVTGEKTTEELRKEAEEAQRALEERNKLDEQRAQETWENRVAEVYEKEGVHLIKSDTHPREVADILINDFKNSGREYDPNSYMYFFENAEIITGGIMDEVKVNGVISKFRKE